MAHYLRVLNSFLRASLAASWLFLGALLAIAASLPPNSRLADSAPLGSAGLAGSGAAGCSALAGVGLAGGLTVVVSSVGDFRNVVSRVDMLPALVSCGTFCW